MTWETIKTAEYRTGQWLEISQDVISEAMGRIYGKGKTRAAAIRMMIEQGEVLHDRENLYRLKRS